MKEAQTLHHEKLIVYQKSIKFLALSETINSNLKRGNATLKDQLGRAALSIPLNISEGYGKYSRKDKVRFYLIAKGSAHECGAVLDSMQILKLVEESAYSRGKGLLFEIVNMLVRLCQI